MNKILIVSALIVSACGQGGDAEVESGGEVSSSLSGIDAYLDSLNEDWVVPEHDFNQSAGQFLKVKTFELNSLEGKPYTEYMSAKGLTVSMSFNDKGVSVWNTARGDDSKPACTIQTVYKDAGLSPEGYRKFHKTSYCEKPCSNTYTAFGASGKEVGASVSCDKPVKEDRDQFNAYFEVTPNGRAYDFALRFDFPDDWNSKDWALVESFE